MNDRGWWQHPARDPLLLAAAIAVVFAHTLGFPFVDWDDRGYVVQNLLVRQPLASGWRVLLTTPQMGYPQPLTVLSHHLDLLIGGGHAWAFHASNVALHMINALLLLTLLRRYELERGAALLVAALFALHPVVAEPVCWVTGRKDLLAATFVLAGMLAYHRARESERGAGRWGFGLAFLAALVAALGCKPIGVALPALAFCDLLVFRRSLDRRLLSVLGVAAALALLFALFAYGTQRQHGAIAPGTPWTARLAYVSQHLALQLRNYLLPTALSPKYLEGFPRPIASLWGAGGLAALLTLAVFCGYAVRRRRPLLLFGLGWALITFAPSSGVIPINRGPADTYLYLPAIGCGLLLAQGLVALRPHAARVGALLPPTLVATLAFAAFVQADVWSSSTNLWRTVVTHYPQNRGSWWAYADALAAGGRLRRAIEVYEEGLSHFPYPPRKPQVVTALGQGCAMLGDRCVVRWYGEAVRHYPPHPGRALLLLGAFTRFDDPRYHRERSRARAIVHRALRELIGAGTAAIARFDRQHVRRNPVAIAALQQLAAAGGPLAAVAKRLLARQRRPASRPARRRAGPTSSSRPARR